jgi:hypothetical protein
LVASADACIAGIGEGADVVVVAENGGVRIVHTTQDRIAEVIGTGIEVGAGRVGDDHLGFALVGGLVAHALAAGVVQGRAVAGKAVASARGTSARHHAEQSAKIRTAGLSVGQCCSFALARSFVACAGNTFSIQAAAVFLKARANAAAAGVAQRAGRTVLAGRAVCSGDCTHRWFACAAVAGFYLAKTVAAVAVNVVAVIAGFADVNISVATYAKTELDYDLAVAGVNVGCVDLAGAGVEGAAATAAVFMPAVRIGLCSCAPAGPPAAAATTDI